MDKRIDFPIFKIIESDNELSLYARALALPVRISILRVLINEGCWINHDVFAEMPFSAVARESHLKALTQLGIVKAKSFNRHKYYSINQEVFEKMAEGFTSLFNFYSRHAGDKTWSDL